MLRPPCEGGEGGRGGGEERVGRERREVRGTSGRTRKGGLTLPKLSVKLVKSLHSSISVTLNGMPRN